MDFRKPELELDLKISIAGAAHFGSSIAGAANVLVPPELKAIFSGAFRTGAHFLGTSAIRSKYGDGEP